MKSVSLKMMREGQELFTRILMKFDLMEKIPFSWGRELISRTQLHMIEAIGKGYGTTVTSLAGYFMVTKGAVSQVVAKLGERGFVAKEKGEGRERILKLTRKGKQAFDLHEGYGELLPEFAAFFGKYSSEELRAFLSVLKGLDEFSSSIFSSLLERGKLGGGSSPASPRGGTGKK